MSGDMHWAPAVKRTATFINTDATFNLFKEKRKNTAILNINEAPQDLTWKRVGTKESTWQSMMKTITLVLCVPLRNLCGRILGLEPQVQGYGSLFIIEELYKQYICAA